MAFMSAPPVSDCWTVLGISRTRDLGTIRTAYLRQAKQQHPDTEQDEAHKEARTQEFLRLQEAYEQAQQHAKGLVFKPPATPAPTTVQEPTEWGFLAECFRSLDGFPVKRLGLVYVLALLGSWIGTEVFPDSHWMQWPLTGLQGVTEGLLLSGLGGVVLSWAIGLLFLLARLLLPQAHAFKGCYVLVLACTVWGFVLTTPEGGWTLSQIEGFYRFTTAATALLVAPLLPALLLLSVRPHPARTSA